MSDVSTAESDPSFGEKLTSRYRQKSAQPVAPTEISGDEDYEKLSPGAQYVGPDKKVRVKPFSVTDDTDYAKVPEGGVYIGPDKKTRTKPKYEGIGFSAETLHDMAVTPEAQREVLEKFYPDKVKEDAGGIYIDDDGTLRRPGHGGIGERLGADVAQAAPIAGITAGGLLGSEMGPPGLFGGSVLGAMAGRQFNNTVLALAGIHQPMSSQISSSEWEGAGAAGGEVLGAGLSKVPGAVQSLAEGVKKVGGIKTGLSDILESVGITPERARYFLGTSLETAQQAADITNRYGPGVVAPSVLAPEAPMLTKIEQMDAVFRGRNVFGEAARDVYEKGGKELVESPDIGVKLEDTLTGATKQVSSKEAGQLALDNFQKKLAVSDAALAKVRQDALDVARKPITEAGGEAAFKANHEAVTTRLVSAHKTAADDATQFVHAAVDSIGNDVENAMRQADTGANPGRLWRVVANKFRHYKLANQARARTLYNESDALGGGVKIPNTGESLGGEAGDFLNRMPEILRSKYPEVQLLTKLAGRQADEDGDGAIPPTDLTLKELRQLRSWLRHGIDYSDLTPDMREGAVKFFAKKVDDFIHGMEIPDSIKPAVRVLDQADAFYKNTMPFLNDSIVTTVMKGLQEGVPPNPEVLSKVLFDSDRTEALRRARSIVGPSLWRLVQAAHTQNVIKSSLNIAGKVDVQRFASQIEEMYRNGILQTGYSKEFAERLVQAARNVRQLEGNLELGADSNDTLSSLIQRAKIMADEVKKQADADPLKALSEGVKRVDKDFNDRLKIARQKRKNEPLHFLYESSMTALPIRAANRILKDPDLIIAAANQFGTDSPEMDALRQVYVQRLFQRPLGKVAGLREEIAGEKGIPEEVQAIMFPGVTRKTMLQLVKDMEFLFGGSVSDVGGSLAAASRVINPWSHIPIPKSGIVKYMADIPGAAVVPRFLLGKFFATVMDGVSHPNFVNWLAGNLTKGGPDREMARRILQDRLKAGGLLGAQLGALAYGQSQ